jgi:hypothetical protein
VGSGNAERRRRLILRGLAVSLTGITCAVASMALSLTGLFTRDGDLTLAARWLLDCSYGCLAGAWLCAFLLWRWRGSR